MATTAAVPPQELAPLSQAQRLINTFVAPSRTFTDLRRSASWWAPFLISVIFSVVFVYVVDQKVGFRKVVENQLRLQPKQAERIEQLPTGQRETAMQRQTSITKGISYGFPLLMLAWHAIVAGVLLATLKFGASAEIKFKTLFLCIFIALCAVTGLVPFAQAAPSSAAACVECHTKQTPNIVSDWKLSKHSQLEVTCVTCHDDQHQSAADVSKVRIPTPETCAQCHKTQVDQYMHGKHSKAWAAMLAMPTIHWQPMAMIEGEKGCGGCHKIGVKPAEEIVKLRQHGSEFGAAACDSCHTRHTFSVEEAKQPQACETCHMGFDHPQWEMYSSSKHGVRADLKQRGILPAGAAAPTCQTCHMQNGDHGVRTAWGFLAVRLPLPEDKQWAADRATILEALGVLDPDGKPTALVATVQAADVARLTQEDWQAERDKMLKTCHQCHSANFAKQQLEMGDDMIRNADHLMAQAIQTVAGLYKDGVLPQPKNYAYPFPNLLTFHDAPTVVEQKLFVMYLEHRMRTFQGTFHGSPDYALWYGWSEMQRDLTEIKELAEQMRREKKTGPALKPTASPASSK